MWQLRILLILVGVILVVSVHGQTGEDSELLVRLSKYDCYDPDFLSTNAAKALLRASFDIVLPRTEMQIVYSRTNLVWMNAASVAERWAMQRDFQMVCVKKQDLNVFALTGSYEGELYNSEGVAIPISTIAVTPVAQARLDGTTNQRVTATLAIMDQFTLESGAPLLDFQYHVLVTDTLGCSVLGTRGCIKVDDYSPNLRTEQGTLECQNFPDDNAVALENCGPPLTVTRAEETSDMVEESVSISRKSGSSLTIGKTFSVTKGVRSRKASSVGSNTKETQKGVTEEEQSTNSMSSTSLKVRTVNREYTVPYGRSLLEERNTEVCTGQGRARGCLDALCTLSFKMDYLYTTTTTTNKFLMEVLPCTA